MKITKARLVEIIKEEIEKIDEIFSLGGFGRTPTSERPSSRKKGNQTPEQARGELEARRREMTDKEDEAMALKDFGRKGAKLYKALSDEIDALEADRKASVKQVKNNIIDLAADMDAEASQKNFERVMSWANEANVATEKDIAQGIVDAMETMDSGMIAKIQDPLLDDPGFIEQLVNKPDFINKIVSALKARNEKAHSEETGE